MGDLRVVDEVDKEYRERKEELSARSDRQMVSDLSQQVSFYQIKIQDDKQLFEQEIVAMNKSYHEKLMEVKEKEAAKDFEIGKIKKEQQLLQEEYNRHMDQSNGIVNNLTKQLEKYSKAQGRSQMARFNNYAQQNQQSQKQLLHKKKESYSQSSKLLV